MSSTQVRNCPQTTLNLQNQPFPHFTCFVVYILHNAFLTCIKKMEEKYNISYYVTRSNRDAVCGEGGKGRGMPSIHSCVKKQSFCF